MKQQLFTAVKDIMKDYMCDHCDGTGISEEMMPDGFDMDVACPKCHGDGFIGSWERLDRELWQMVDSLDAHSPR